MDAAPVSDLRCHSYALRALDRRDDDDLAAIESAKVNRFAALVGQLLHDRRSDADEGLLGRCPLLQRKKLIRHSIAAVLVAIEIAAIFECREDRSEERRVGKE